MPKENQRELIQCICDNIKGRLINSIEQIPSDWEGIEVRWLIQHLAENHLKAPKRKREFNSWIRTHSVF